MDFLNHLASQVASKLTSNQSIPASSPNDALANSVASKVLQVLGASAPAQAASRTAPALASAGRPVGASAPHPMTASLQQPMPASAARPAGASLQNPMLASLGMSDYIASKVAFHLQGKASAASKDVDIDKLAQLVSNKMKAADPGIAEKDVDFSKEQDNK